VLYGSDPHTCPVRALQTWLATIGKLKKIGERNSSAELRPQRHALTNPKPHHAQGRRWKSIPVARRYIRPSRAGTIMRALASGSNVETVQRPTVQTTATSSQRSCASIGKRGLALPTDYRVVV
jgi:hypothetical protein